MSIPPIQYPNYNVFIAKPDVYATQSDDTDYSSNNPLSITNGHITNPDSNQAMRKRKFSTKLSLKQAETIILCQAVIKSSNEQMGRQFFWEKTAGHYNEMKQDSMSSLTDRQCCAKMTWLEKSMFQTNKILNLEGSERWKTVAKCWLDNQEKNKFPIEQSFIDNQNNSQADILNLTKKAKYESTTTPHSNSFEKQKFPENVLQKPNVASDQNVESSLNWEKLYKVSEGYLGHIEQSNMIENQESHHATPTEVKDSINWQELFKAFNVQMPCDVLKQPNHFNMDEHVKICQEILRNPTDKPSNKEPILGECLLM